MWRNLKVPAILGCLLATGCVTTVLTGAIYEYRGQQYLITQAEDSEYTLGVGFLMIEDETTIRISVQQPDGRWTRVSSGLYEHITDDGRFVRRISSSRIRETPYGNGVIIAPRNRPTEERSPGEGGGDH